MVMGEFWGGIDLAFLKEIPDFAMGTFWLK